MALVRQRLPVISFFRRRSKVNHINHQTVHIRKRWQVTVRIIGAVKQRQLVVEHAWLGPVLTYGNPITKIVGITSDARKVTEITTTAVMEMEKHQSGVIPPIPTRDMSFVNLNHQLLHINHQTVHIRKRWQVTGRIIGVAKQRQLVVDNAWIGPVLTYGNPITKIVGITSDARKVTEITTTAVMEMEKHQSGVIPPIPTRDMSFVNR